MQPDLDPDATASIMIHIAPQCVETIRDYDDADFLAAVAVGETFRAIPSLTRRRVADRLWVRSRAYRVNVAAIAAVAAALDVSGSFEGSPS